MNIIGLSVSNLRAKPLSALLSIVLAALGVSLVAILLLLNKQFQDKLYKNIDGIDAVVAARGSKLQMILSSVYHVDAPTGNIPIDESVVVTKNPLFVEEAIPLSLGDSYKGFRIVGTDLNYPKHYKAEIAEGRFWAHEMEATIGTAVAQRLGLKIGDTFAGAHGLTNTGVEDVHDTHKYKVVGIMKPTGIVLDQLILTQLSSVWRVHSSHDHDHDEAHAHHDEEVGTAQHHHATHESHKGEKQDLEAEHIEEDPHAHEGHAHEGHDHEAHAHDEGHAHEGHDHEAHAHEEGHAHEGHDHEAHAHDEGHAHEVEEATGTEVTAYLVKYKKQKNGRASTTAPIEFPKMVRDFSDKLEVASPGVQLNRLLGLTGVGVDALNVLALIFIIISAFSVFISLYNSLKSRRYEIALMRVMGASRAKIFILVILEGLFITGLGFVIGIVVSHVGMQVLAGQLQDAFQYNFSAWMFLPEELYLFIGALAVGFLAAVFPAIQASNTDISDTLSRS